MLLSIYKIYWECLRTGNKGQSQEPMSYESAKTWTERLNKKYPYIKHTVK